ALAVRLALDGMACRSTSAAGPNGGRDLARRTLTPAGDRTQGERVSGVFSAARRRAGRASRPIRVREGRGASSPGDGDGPGARDAAAGRALSPQPRAATSAHGPAGPGGVAPRHGTVDVPRHGNALLAGAGAIGGARSGLLKDAVAYRVAASMSF